MSRLLYLTELPRPGRPGVRHQSPFTESNRRPSPYHGDALPTELKGQRPGPKRSERQRRSLHEAPGRFSRPDARPPPVSRPTRDVGNIYWLGDTRAGFVGCTTGVYTTVSTERFFMTRAGSMPTGTAAPGRASIAARTLRTDNWRKAPLLTFTLLSIWVLYALVRTVSQRAYFVAAVPLPVAVLLAVRERVVPDRTRVTSAPGSATSRRSSRWRCSCCRSCSASG